MPEKLTEDTILSLLKNLPGWKFENNSIKKIFRTRNFPSTMGFVAAVCGLCQRLNHHPDYITMKFKEVELSFSTHVAAGVTENDINIAKEIEEKIPL